MDDGPTLPFADVVDPGVDAGRVKFRDPAALLCGGGVSTGLDFEDHEGSEPEDPEIWEARRAATAVIGVIGEKAHRLEHLSHLAKGVVLFPLASHDHLFLMTMSEQTAPMASDRLSSAAQSKSSRP